MILTLNHIVSKEIKKSLFDGRVKVMRFIASYFGEDGHEYRKSFESKLIDPNVPERGTHKELNALSKQW